MRRMRLTDVGRERRVRSNPPRGRRSREASCSDKEVGALKSVSGSFRARGISLDDEEEVRRGVEGRSEVEVEEIGMASIEERS